MLYDVELSKSVAAAESGQRQTPGKAHTLARAAIPADFSRERILSSLNARILIEGNSNMDHAVSGRRGFRPWRSGQFAAELGDERDDGLAIFAPPLRVPDRRWSPDTPPWVARLALLRHVPCSRDSDALDLDLPGRVGEPADDERARRLAIAQHLAAPFAGRGEVAMVRQDGGDLDEIVQGHAGSLELRFEILPSEAALLDDVVGDRAVHLWPTWPLI